MTDQTRDNRYQVSADRESPVRRVRYVETNMGDADDCTLCQLDEGTPATAAQAEQEPDTTFVTEADDDDEVVRQQLTGAIENQLQANDPPFVQAVLNKLTLVGIEREEIINMMAYVLAIEIGQCIDQNRSFDADNYEKMLRALPDLSAIEA